MEVTVRDVIRYNVAHLGQAIFKLKKDCQELNPLATCLMYEHKETGELIAARKIQRKVVDKTKDGKIDGEWWHRVWVVKAITYCKIEKHINPAHKRWAEYQGLKRQAKAWCDAITVLNYRVKAGHENIYSVLSSCVLVNAGEDSNVREDAAIVLIRRVHEKLEEGARYPQVEEWLKEKPGEIVNA